MIAWVSNPLKGKLDSLYIFLRESGTQGEFMSICTFLKVLQLPSE